MSFLGTKFSEITTVLDPLAYLITMFILCMKGDALVKVMLNFKY